MQSEAQQSQVPCPVSQQQQRWDSRSLASHSVLLNTLLFCLSCYVNARPLNFFKKWSATNNMRRLYFCLVPCGLVCFSFFMFPIVTDTDPGKNMLRLHECVKIKLVHKPDLNTHVCKQRHQHVHI